ncbi:MAG TPA: exonuclease domain-containing protein [Alphaproteobacteria bacterium]|nr:exonuclease domain-containing protein [Alphaproteobacteria bacterium]
MRFLAIDFETGTDEIASACSIGLALGDERRVLREHYSLIRPPRHEGWVSDIHHITWQDVADQPSFGELWPEIKPLFDAADAFIAHKAQYDKSVLEATCAEAGTKAPDKPWICSLHMAEHMWKLPSYRLDDLSRGFGIALERHNALSDAQAALKIVQRALAEGGKPEFGLLKKSDRARLPRG